MEKRKPLQLKLYAVRRRVQYEGTDVDSVWSDRKLAEERAEALSNDGYSCEPWTVVAFMLNKAGECIA